MTTPRFAPPLVRERAIAATARQPIKAGVNAEEDDAAACAELYDRLQVLQEVLGEINTFRPTSSNPDIHACLFEYMHEERIIKEMLQSLSNQRVHGVQRFKDLFIRLTGSIKSNWDEETLLEYSRLSTILANNQSVTGLTQMLGLLANEGGRRPSTLSESSDQIHDHFERLNDRIQQLNSLANGAEKQIGDENQWTIQDDESDSSSVYSDMSFADPDDFMAGMNARIDKAKETKVDPRTTILSSFQIVRSVPTSPRSGAQEPGGRRFSFDTPLSHWLSSTNHSEQTIRCNNRLHNVACAKQLAEWMLSAEEIGKLKSHKYLTLGEFLGTNQYDEWGPGGSKSFLRPMAGKLPGSLLPATPRDLPKRPSIRQSIMGEQASISARPSIGNILPHRASISILNSARKSIQNTAERALQLVEDAMSGKRKSTKTVQAVDVSNNTASNEGVVKRPVKRLNRHLLAPLIVQMLAQQALTKKAAAAAAASSGEEAASVATTPSAAVLGHENQPPSPRGSSPQSIVTTPRKPGLGLKLNLQSLATVANSRPPMGLSSTNPLEAAGILSTPPIKSPRQQFGSLTAAFNKSGTQQFGRTNTQQLEHNLDLEELAGVSAPLSARGGPKTAIPRIDRTKLDPWLAQQGLSTPRIAGMTPRGPPSQQLASSPEYFKYSQQPVTADDSQRSTIAGSDSDASPIKSKISPKPAVMPALNLSGVANMYAPAQ